jgi:beta-galactosidase/beta-glucuronidase
MKRSLLIIGFTLFTIVNFAQETETIYLSGVDADRTKTWEFYCTKGRNSGIWSTIEVPSCWEMKGFGTINYGNIPEKLADEKGLYRYNFPIPSNWKNKNVFIVFDGSMTDTEVKINSKLVGPIHQGSFYRFKYEISKLIKYGQQNTLEVTVSKMSSDLSINRAEREVDFWVFGAYTARFTLKLFLSSLLKG